MKFLSLPVERAEGSILGHNVASDDGRRVLRKGKPLTAGDIETLRRLGRSHVYVARLAAGDVGEDEAARRLGGPLAGPGLRPSAARTGRVNLYAQELGLLRVDLGRLEAINGCDGVTLATLHHHSVVALGKMAATLKVLPYALPGALVERAEELAAGDPVLRLDPLPRRRVGLLLSGSPGARERVVGSFQGALGERLANLGSAIERVDFVPLDDGDGEANLARVLGEQLAAGVELVILAGETAIQDRYDIAPRAVERAGATIACFGAPVDPGNLLLLAYHHTVPIVGAPGCSRSPKRNIVDLVLPRLLAGDRLERADVLAWGHGGLLEDVPERPLPRSWLT